MIASNIVLLVFITLSVITVSTIVIIKKTSDEKTSDEKTSDFSAQWYTEGVDVCPTDLPHSCGIDTFGREITCIRPDGSTAHDSDCNPNTKPSSVLECGQNRPCNWQYSEYGDCVNRIQERTADCDNPGQCLGNPITSSSCQLICGEGETYYTSVDACLRCPPGQEYDYNLETCRISCAEGQEYDYNLETCRISCAEGQEYDYDLEICRISCGEGGIYSSGTDSCLVCPQGQEYDNTIGGICRESCVEGDEYDYTLGICRTSCLGYETYYSSEDACLICPPGEEYDGYLDGGTCRISCVEGEEYDHDLDGGTCRISCAEGEEYYANEDACLVCPPGQEFLDFDETCHDMCDSNQTRCGAVCYLESQLTCINDSELCSPNNICEVVNSAGEASTVCCPMNQGCNNGVCSTCIDGEICGDDCCEGDTSCVGGTCCDADKISGDGVCCQTTTCGDENICCGSDTICIDGICKVECDDEYCDPANNEVCSIETVGDTNRRMCYVADCRSDSMVYNPPLVDTTNLCKDNVGKLYSVKNPTTGFSGMLTKGVSTIFNTDGCGFLDCKYKMAENGIIQLNYNDDNHSCQGVFDCNNLPTIEQEPTCPLQESKQNQCCVDSNSNFTGQVCDDGFMCVDNECIKGWVCDPDVGCITTTDNVSDYLTKAECEENGCKVARSGDTVELLIYHGNTRYYIQNADTSGDNHRIRLHQNANTNNNNNVNIYGYDKSDNKSIGDGVILNPSMHNIGFRSFRSNRRWIHARDNKSLMWQNNREDNGTFEIYSEVDLSRKSNTTLHYGLIAGRLHSSGSSNSKYYDVVSRERESGDPSGVYQLRIRNADDNNAVTFMIKEPL